MIPGYETVPPRPPLPRMNQYHDPPYARLESSKDEEMESEEGYETIPASERQNRNGNIFIFRNFFHKILKNFTKLAMDLSFSFFFFSFFP